VDDVPTINSDELRVGLERAELVAIMTMDEAAFDRAHIPGSIALTGADAAKERFAPTTPLVVYCTDPACRASLMAFRQLKDAGFSDVRHYPGGLSEWAATGHPLAGVEAGPRA